MHGAAVISYENRRLSDELDHFIKRAAGEVEKSTGRRRGGGFGEFAGAPSDAAARDFFPDELGEIAKFRPLFADAAAVGEDDEIEIRIGVEKFLPRENRSGIEFQRKRNFFVDADGAGETLENRDRVVRGRGLRQVDAAIAEKSGEFPSVAAAPFLRRFRGSGHQTGPQQSLHVPDAVEPAICEDFQDFQDAAPTGFPAEMDDFVNERRGLDQGRKPVTSDPSDTAFRVMSGHVLEDLQAVDDVAER